MCLIGSFEGQLKHLRRGDVVLLIEFGVGVLGHLCGECVCVCACARARESVCVRGARESERESACTSV